LTDPRSESGHDATGASVGTGYANYVLGVLFVVYVLNFVDRQILSVFIGPIKAEFGVSDTAMGLLAGFAFALFYTFAGIPLARWADRGDRRLIITLGLGLWSAMTIATGFARSFLHLALARIGVGVGEAAGTPPAHSLISDYFPPERRATAIGVYSAGVYVGSALAYLGGGLLREHFDWRTAFWLLGAPGLFFALVVAFTVREPPRGLSEKRAATPTPERASLRETLRYLLTCRSWVYLQVGSALLSIAGYGVLIWGYEFFGRVHALAPIQTGQAMGLVVGVGGALGTLGGGMVVDRLSRRDVRWSMRLPAIINFASVPLGLVYLLSDHTGWAIAFFFPFYTLMNVFVPALHTLNQNLARLRMRATASAVSLFILNIVGAGAGPFIVGFLNDAFAGRFGDGSIRYSLLVVTLVTLVSSVLFHVGSRTLAEDLERARGPLG
jgi:predicted MFS family arabinose efflux permease